MSANQLLALIIVVYWVALAIGVKASKRTTSLFPIIPLIPGVLWGIGALLNHFASPWGTIAIGVVHVVLLGLMLFLALRWKKERQKQF